VSLSVRFLAKVIDVDFEVVKGSDAVDSQATHYFRYRAEKTLKHLMKAKPKTTKVGCICHPDARSTRP
jgi:hypothetical protein